MIPLRRCRSAVSWLALLGILIAPAVAAAAAGLPAPPVLPKPGTPQAAPAIDQSPVPLEVQSAIVWRHPGSHSLTLQLEVLNQGAVATKAAQVFVEAFYAGSTSSQMQTLHGLNIAPSEHGSLTMVLNRNVFPRDLRHTRFMVSAIGGATMSWSCKNTMAQANNICPATVRMEPRTAPMTAANVQTGPSGESTPVVTAAGSAAPWRAAAMAQPEAMVYADSPVVQQDPDTGDLVPPV